MDAGTKDLQLLNELIFFTQKMMEQGYHYKKGVYIPEEAITQTNSKEIICKMSINMYDTREFYNEINLRMGKWLSSNPPNVYVEDIEKKVTNLKHYARLCEQHVERINRSLKERINKDEEMMITNPITGEKMKIGVTSYYSNQNDAEVRVLEGYLGNIPQEGVDLLTESYMISKEHKNMTLQEFEKHLDKIIIVTGKTIKEGNDLDIMMSHESILPESAKTLREIIKDKYQKNNYISSKEINSCIEKINASIVLLEGYMLNKNL